MQRFVRDESVIVTKTHNPLPSERVPLSMTTSNINRHAHSTVNFTHSGSYHVSILTNIDDMRDEYQEIVTKGFSTPYQHMNWIESCITSFHAENSKNSHFVFGVVRNASQHIQMILPLKIESVAGVRYATFLGEKHANYHMPLYSVEAMRDLTVSSLKVILEHLAVALKKQFGQIDLFSFYNQPEKWMERVNPLAHLNSQSSPSDAYGLALEQTFEGTIAQVMSKETLKKLRKKLKALEAMPDFKVIHAQTEEEVDRLLNAFFEQKRVRFMQQGIQNPFEREDVKSFLTTLFMNGRLNHPRSASLNGISIDGNIIAVNGGVMCDNHFTALISSFDMNPLYTRYSPGQVLFLKVIELKVSQGLSYFDFGVGEASYKEIFSSHTISLRDSLIPMSMKGRIARKIMNRYYNTKRVIKRTPQLWQAFQGMRTIKAKIKAIISKK
jgi:CelD/BcsL family acetyltransferase involved in cellulose biosynthesis